MRTPRQLPDGFAGRPFHRTEALAAGITSRMLQHDRFVQVHPRVYRLAETPLDAAGRIRAAQLALPEDAQVSHQTRLRLLGLDRGPGAPLHFTVDRDLHIDLDGIFLHRTVSMPAIDGVGVTPEAALLGAASLLRAIDVIAVGDWLIHRGHANPATLAWIVHEQSWRPGAAELKRVLSLLDGRARSLPESEVRTLIGACGLPAFEVNADVRENGDFLGCGDLVDRRRRLVIEYEGRQHAFDVDQFAHDIGRYEGFRRHGWDYVQVTADVLARPRSLMNHLHRRLRDRGYDGPPPVFGEGWHQLFAPPETLRHRRSVA